MKLPVRGSLVFRLYAVGVAQLLFVALAAVAIAMISFRFMQRGDPERIRSAVQPVVDDGVALEAKLERLRVTERVGVTVYDHGGNVVASNTTPPLSAGFNGWTPQPAEWPSGQPGEPNGPPFTVRPRGDGSAGSGESPPTGAPPDHWDDRHARGGPPPSITVTTINIGGSSGTLVARFPPARPSAIPPLLTLAIGLLIVAIGAVLTARWIAGPLEQISVAARSLGKGNLRARADLRGATLLGDVGAAFDEMASRIESLLLAEKELLANVAHELRTPLARVRVALDLAAEGNVTVASAALREIAVDVAELEALTEDLLVALRFDLSARGATHGGFPLSLQALSASAVGRQAVERFATHHATRRLDAVMSETTQERAGQRGSDIVCVDIGLFRRVLDNVLGNAHKYSPDPASSIRFSLSTDRSDATFVVEDDGIGISSEDLPRIFTPFFRSERSRSRGTGGVGLGLTLSRRIVEAHGGTIDVTSAEGVGTVVRVRIPLVAPETV